MAFLGSSIKMYLKTLYISNMEKPNQNYYPVTHKRKYFFTRLEMVYGVGILEKVNLHKEYTCVVKEAAGHTFILHFSYEIMTCLKKKQNCLHIIFRYLFTTCPYYSSDDPVWNSKSRIMLGLTRLSSI